LLWHCAPAYCSDDLAIIFPTKDLSVNIYVGNLAFTASEDDVRQLFEQYGEVDRVNLITDRETGRARGFGFVDMPDSREAQSAIQGLQGKDLNGRALTVNEAKPREPRRETSRPRW
jgi:RNA recognition motif-containing protein